MNKLRFSGFVLNKEEIVDIPDVPPRSEYSGFGSRYSIQLTEEEPGTPRYLVIPMPAQYNLAVRIKKLFG